MTEGVKELAGELQAVLSRAPGASEEERLRAVRDAFEQKCRGMDPSEKVRCLKELRDYFSREVEVPVRQAGALAEIAEAMLGKGSEELEGMSDEEILQGLKDSLDIIFETLNQIVSSLNVAVGADAGISRDKTIRMLIHERLKSGEDTGNLSIQAYLDHIKYAFGAVRDAFEEALDEKIKEIFQEIEPDTLARELGDKGLKLGPLYKASLFDFYEERFNHLRNFVHRGLFTREVMLAFERRFSEMLSESLGKKAQRS